MDEMVPLDPKEPIIKRKPGRPKGANNKNFLTLQFWFNQMRSDMDQLKPYQRAIIAQKMLQSLMTHDRHLKQDVKADEIRGNEDQMNESDLLASLEPMNDEARPKDPETKA